MTDDFPPEDQQLFDALAALPKPEPQRSRPIGGLTLEAKRPNEGSSLLAIAARCCRGGGRRARDRRRVVD